MKQFKCPKSYNLIIGYIFIFRFVIFEYSMICETWYHHLKYWDVSVVVTSSVVLNYSNSWYSVVQSNCNYSYPGVQSNCNCSFPGVRINCNCWYPVVQSNYNFWYPVVQSNCILACRVTETARTYPVVQSNCNCSYVSCRTE